MILVEAKSGRPGETGAPGGPRGLFKYSFQERLFWRKKATLFKAASGRPGEPGAPGGPRVPNGFFDIVCKKMFWGRKMTRVEKDTLKEESNFLDTRLKSKLVLDRNVKHKYV